MNAYQPPARITFTGVDAQTSLRDLWRTSQSHPQCEWGVLIRSFNETGMEGKRYPTWAFVDEFLDQARQQGAATALHCCKETVHALWQGEERVTALAMKAGRIELNNRLAPATLPLLATWLANWKGPEVILQGNRHTQSTLQAHPEWPVSVLFDSSGGRGVAPTQWPRPWRTDRWFGFAGGLGPDAPAPIWQDIAAAAGGQPYWVDMEQRLRNEQDDWVHERVEAVLRHLDGLTDPRR